MRRPIANSSSRYSTEEVGQALNEEGIAVRSGHHCAQPILRRLARGKGKVAA